MSSGSSGVWGVPCEELGEGLVRVPDGGDVPAPRRHVRRYQRVLEELHALQRHLVLLLVPAARAECEDAGRGV